MHFGPDQQCRPNSSLPAQPTAKVAIFLVSSPQLPWPAIADASGIQRRPGGDIEPPRALPANPSPHMRPFLFLTSPPSIPLGVWSCRRRRPSLPWPLVSPRRASSSKRYVVVVLVVRKEQLEQEIATAPGSSRPFSAPPHASLRFAASSSSSASSTGSSHPL
jgi:hypothetical protein